MLKITKSFEKLALKVFKAGNNRVDRDGGGKANETIVDLFKSKNEKSRKPAREPNIGATKESIFLIFDAKNIFKHLRQAFIKALIL